MIVIDELNRGNVSQIFGENITILEKDKRGSQRRLSHSGEEFTVPENVYLIGTMNTADQSIARLDAAIRRRFSFIHLPPDCDVFYELDDDDYPSTRQEAADLIEAGRADAETLIATSILALEIINQKIVEISSLGKGKRIGHSYLLPETWRDAEGTDENTIITDIWRYDILPLLEEYFFQDITALERQIFSGEENFVDQSTNDIETLHPQDLRDKLTAFVLDNQELLNVDFQNE